METVIETRKLTKRYRDVVAVDGRTPLRVADGVEYGNSFAAHPHTAELLRKLGAKEIECPAPCAAVISVEDLR